MRVQHGLMFMYTSVGSCHMYCTCSSITLHSKLYMFPLFICIIVNIGFILFYLQVESVFYLRTTKSYPNHFLCHQYRQHSYIYFPDYMYYAISVPLITTENMRFRPYSYPCFFMGDINF